MIHSYDDGLGLREVFVNGSKIEHVRCADTNLGIVEVADWPLEIETVDGKYRVKTHKISGHVEVVFK